MKLKQLSTMAVALLCSVSLAACGSTSTKSTDSSSSTSTSSSHKAKHHKKHTSKRAATKASSNSDAQAQGNTNGTTAGNGPKRHLTQGEINRMRGYDPNGNPLLPGQDHAAGSNPDGTPDAWVQWQIDWEREHGNDYYPDGTPTPGGNAANQQQNNQPVANSQSGAANTSGGPAPAGQ